MISKYNSYNQEINTECQKPSCTLFSGWAEFSRQEHLLLLPVCTGIQGLAYIDRVPSFSLLTKRHFSYPILVEKNYLPALYLNETYCHKTGTRPPSCLSPRQMTIYGVIQC